MKNIVILGATSAMAEAYCQFHAKQEGDTHFHLVARNKERLKLVADNLTERYSVSVSQYVFDLVNLSTHDNLISKITNQKIDLLLIAYGTLGDQVQSQSNFELANEVITTNFTSAVSLLTRLTSFFERQKEGTIAVISSVAGDRGRQSNYIYGASKGALSIYLSGLRNRLNPFGVNVLTIKPGFVDTPMTKEFKKGLLFVSPSVIGKDIYSAVVNKKSIIYTPFFWKYIMLIIIHIPESIFKKLRL